MTLPILWLVMAPEFSMEFSNYEKAPNSVADDLKAKYEEEKKAKR